jgi:uncharacterized surface protein with fasciclin (FAS1) repeats
MERFFNTTKLTNFSLLTLSALMISSLMMFSSCDPDKVGDKLFTFTDQMMGQYLEDPENAEFTEFAKILDTTNTIGLLKAYGHFTCFAPTNMAMKEYYTLKGKTGLKDFSMDSLRIIAYDHIINGTVVNHANFINGRLSQLSMSDRYISISFTNAGETYVNKNSLITTKDILVHNGVIHKISRVLDPTRDGILEVIAKDPRFSLFYEALILTGMGDSLLLVRDDSYKPLDYKHLITTPKESNQWFYQEVPPSRKYGYTVLMESNETFRAAGINNLDDLKAYAASVYNQVYPEDAGITDIYDRRNSLNRFISYHLIGKQLSYAKFINAYDTDHMLKNRDMYEYVETLCPNTLIEVKKERLTNRTNLFNHVDEASVVQLTSNYDNDATNGVFHEINRILVYSEAVNTYMSTKRLRFDAASFFPELTNNDMRGSRWLQNSNSTMYAEQSLHYQIPRGYIARIEASEQTVVGYLAGYPRFQNYMADEIFLSASSGKLYDFTITTPPIPAGTYEVRFGYLTNGKRGVAQLYLDGIPAGVPLNLNNSATHVSIGYQAPGSLPVEDPFGFENDKMMRNRGFMKGPASFKVAMTGWTSGENARYSSANLRRIMGTYEFREAGHHKLMVKGLSGGEFMFDYLEFVPTSAIENEDIY